MRNEVVRLVVSVMHGIIITSVLLGICPKKKQTNLPDLLESIVIRMIGVFGIGIVSFSVADYRINMVLIAFWVLLYSRLFLSGSVWKHEILMMMVAGTSYIARLAALLGTRAVMGVSVTTPVMNGLTGVYAYFIQFELAALMYWGTWYLWAGKGNRNKCEAACVCALGIVRVMINFFQIYATRLTGMVNEDITGSVRLNMLLFDVLCILGYFGYIYIMDIEKLRDYNLMLEKMKEQKKIVLARQEDYFNLRRECHDNRQKNDMYLRMLESGNVNEVIGELRKEKGTLDSVQAYVEGNHMINAVLNEYAIRSRQEEVVFDADVSIELPHEFESDIAIVISNLLENAIAAEQLSREKKIKLKIFAHNKMYNIVCKNCIRGSVLLENPKLATSKEDSKRHGIGISGIRKIVDDLEGIADFSEENGYFVAHVMIPF